MTTYLGKSCSATCVRVMHLVMHSLNWKEVLAFLDDVLIMGKTFENRLGNLAMP